MTDAKTHLTQSSAGIRLIALLSLFNKGDFSRLRHYITDNFHDSALAEVPASTRLAELKAIYRLHGKLRVAQVIGAGKYQVIVGLEAEKGVLFMAGLTVEEDYPHKILAFSAEALPEEI